MRISFRQAEPQDFEYCAHIYFAEMDGIIRELNLDKQKHAANFRQQWNAAEVRIIIFRDSDIGWLQIRPEGDATFIAQFFVTASFQGQGIGTTVLNGVIGESARVGRAVTLGVVKTNPALRLYTRSGFKITHEDERKFYMRRETDAAAPISR